MIAYAFEIVDLNFVILSLLEKRRKMSKVSRDTILESVQQVLELSKAKERKFQETIELQVNLKNYDPQKEKRFSGKLSYLYSEAYSSSQLSPGVRTI